MSVLSIIAVCILALIAFWLFGSFVLRWGGGALLLLPLLALAAGGAGGTMMLWLIVPASVAWVAGHWLFSRRHGYYKSQLVEVIADRVPRSRHARVLR